MKFATNPETQDFQDTCATVTRSVRVPEDSGEDLQACYHLYLWDGSWDKGQIWGEKWWDWIGTSKWIENWIQTSRGRQIEENKKFTAFKIFPHILNSPHTPYMVLQHENWATPKRGGFKAMVFSITKLILYHHLGRLMVGSNLVQYKLDLQRILYSWYLECCSFYWILTWGPWLTPGVRGFPRTYFLARSTLLRTNSS